MEEYCKKKLEEFYEKQLGFVNSGSKKLRRGITTGSVATAVSKAAVYYLINNKQKDYIDIQLSTGKKINILIEKYEFDKEKVTVYARKYAGDDIDATNFALIYATAKKRDDNNIIITGGSGVGIVTKEGLDIEVGQSAINKTPKENIIKEIRTISNIGFDIKISVENGKEIAKKTFNERLGIMGGISIIGTSGIVEPMSVDAITASITKELKIKTKNTDNIVLTFGNMGEKSLNLLGIKSEKICICSNYIGYALEDILNYKNIKKVLIAGNFSKAVKLSGGIFNTHSHVADAKNEIVASNLALMKAPYILVELVMNSLTTRQICEYINKYNYQEVYNILSKKASEKCTLLTKNTFKTSILMFDYENNILNNINDINDFIN